MYDTTFTIANYLVRHSLVLPSKFSDYDYDDRDPNRRFLSDIFHKLEFFDAILNNSLCTILFTSDTSMILCDALYHMNDNLGIDNNTVIQGNPIFKTINDVYVESFINKPSYMSLIRDRDKLILSIISQYHSTREAFKVLLNERDCITLAAILESSDAYSLFSEDWYK